MSIPLEFLEEAYAKANSIITPFAGPVRISIVIPESAFQHAFDPYAQVQYYQLEFMGPRPFRMKAIQQKLPFKELWDINDLF